MNTIGLEYWGCASQVFIIDFSHTVRRIKQRLVICLALIIGVLARSSCSDSITAMAGKLARLLIPPQRKCRQQPQTSNQETNPSLLSCIAKFTQLRVFTLNRFSSVSVVPFGLAQGSAKGSAKGSAIHLHSTLCLVYNPARVFTHSRL